LKKKPKSLEVLFSSAKDIHQGANFRQIRGGERLTVKRQAGFK